MEIHLSNRCLLTQETINVDIVFVLRHTALKPLWNRSSIVSELFETAYVLLLLVTV